MITRTVLIGISLLGWSLNGVAERHSFEIVEIQHFKLDQPKTHEWEKEKPQIREGSILIARVSKNTYPATQAYVPQVFVGERVLERINSGFYKQYIAYLSPARVNIVKDRVLMKQVNLLPERLDKKKRREIFERAKAKQKFPRKLQNASFHHFPSERELYERAAQMLIKYDPEAASFLAHLL